MRLSDGLRAVAAYEAAKGALVLFAGFGLLSLLQHDAQYFAEQLVAHLHLNPAKGYPRIFIDAMTNVTDARLWLLAGLALVYAAVKGILAYGLWLERRWAEWFAVASVGIYVPAEVYEIVRGVTWTKILLLIVNVCIVAYLIYVLWRLKGSRIEQQNKETGS
ncbi:MAG: DUF2127 domain-containing protein [Betaproteobacteria bacterium]|nr:DUF2127 domain-containing protein [Betaproteobacteria bacterium]